MKLAIDTKFDISNLVKFSRNGFTTPIVYRISSVHVFIDASRSPRIVYDVFDSASLTPHLEWFDEDDLILFNPPVIDQELPF